MTTFKHMGKMGDLVFSLPAIRELGGGALYIPESMPDQVSGQYSFMKDLLLQQPQIHEVREYPSGLNYHMKAKGIHIDYDLDDARYQQNRGVIHVVKRYLDTFNINIQNWKEPWLKVEGDPIWDKPYYLINVTPRFRDNSKVNWGSVYERMPGIAFFVGTESEHIDFCKSYGRITRLHASTALELAILIRDCEALYCNQSLCLAIAQGISKKYFLEQKPKKTNCLLYTKNENIL